MAKLALINREAKREALVKKFAAKRAELKAIIDDQTHSMEERMDAHEASCRRCRAIRARRACATAAR